MQLTIEVEVWWQSFVRTFQVTLQWKPSPTDLRIRNRHLVLRVLIHDAPVYIHDVYEQVKADERVLFMSSCSHTTSLWPPHISYSGIQHTFWFIYRCFHWSNSARVESISVFRMAFTDGCDGCMENPTSGGASVLVHSHAKIVYRAGNI